MYFGIGFIGFIIYGLVNFFILAVVFTIRITLLFLVICAGAVIALGAAVASAWIHARHRRFTKRASAQREEIIHDHQAKSAGPRDWAPSE